MRTLHRSQVSSRKQEIPRIHFLNPKAIQKKGSTKFYLLPFRCTRMFLHYKSSLSKSIPEYFVAFRDFCKGIVVRQPHLQVIGFVSCTNIAFRFAVIFDGISSFRVAPYLGKASSSLELKSVLNGESLSSCMT